jgi:hypothetical protein
MPSSFTVTGSDTKITFDYTAPTATIQSVVGDAAEYLWDKGAGDHGLEEEPILFTDLTNDQKLTLVEDHIKDVIINAANIFKSLKAQEVARTAEEDSKYSL